MSDFEEPRYRTGQSCPESGQWVWVRNTDDTLTAPTVGEFIIPLETGETFPPIRSTEKGAVRKRLLGPPPPFPPYLT